MSLKKKSEHGNGRSKMLWRKTGKKNKAGRAEKGLTSLSKREK
jgi:hypothetical protein